MKRHDNATRSRTAGDRYARRQISPVERAPGWPWSSAAVIAALRLHPLAGYGCLGPATERRRLARLPGGRSPFTTAPTADARLAQRNLLGSWRRMPIDRRPRKSAGPKSGPNALSSGLACLSIPFNLVINGYKEQGNQLRDVVWKPVDVHHVSLRSRVPSVFNPPGVQLSLDQFFGFLARYCI
jgi:hypothetical protein